VLGIAGLLVWGVAEAWLVFGQGVGQMILNGFVVGTGVIAALLFRRSNRRQDEVLNFSITGRKPQQLPETVSLRVLVYLDERAAILASLLSRASSEVYLEHNQLPPGAEIVTRQIQNTLLRQKGLWEKLDPTEKALVSAADGLWTAEHRAEVLVWCEQLRLLRWTLGIDAELVPLAHNPPVDFSLAQYRLQGTEIAQSGKRIRASWDLRGEQDIALEYFARVVAELKGRALIADSAELDGWADEFREKSLGASVDYVVGPKTIGDLNEGPLRLLGILAHARSEYAGYLVELLSGGDVVPFAEWSATRSTVNER